MAVLQAGAALSGDLLAGLAPMLAQGADGPLDSPEYAYEVKWDGMRALAGVGEGIGLRTRRGLEAITRFPELRCLREVLSCDTAVVDGEIVRLVDGRPNFNLLQRRIQASRPAEIERLTREEPAAFILFDILAADGHSFLALPWEERRARLEAVIQPNESCQLSPVWSDGRGLWETAAELGLEGIMAKRRAGRYLPGRRSPAWLKIRRQRTVEAIVGGWTVGTGHRKHTFGAMMLGWLHEGRLLWIGNVGTGMDETMIRESAALLREIETPECPFAPMPPGYRGARWVRPLLVCDICFLEWSADGKLRFPVFDRWRPDRRPDDCTLELLQESRLLT